MKYIEQLKRTKRFYERLKEMNRAQVDYEDDLWSFFQHCWHLKDWVKNDPLVKKSMCDSVESTVATCEAIMKVADLANQSKHLVLNRPARRGARHCGTDVSIHIGSPVGCEYVYRITDGNGLEIPALDLGKDAIKEWETLLRAWGLALE